MAVHTELTPAEAADRLALRELFDAYAHCADRRDAEGQKALFTDDTRFAVYMDGEGSEPTYVLQGREALTPVFEDLNRYEVTTHFNGQSTVTIDGNRARARATRSPTTSTPKTAPARSWSPRSATSTRSRRLTGAGTSPLGISSSTGARRDPWLESLRPDVSAFDAPGSVISDSPIAVGQMPLRCEPCCGASVFRMIEKISAHQAIDPLVDHVRGPKAAPLLVEYGDYECPYSRRAFREIERVERRLERGVRFVFRHFPLTEIHPHALAAAAAAEAASGQDRFWDMHERLFHGQKALEEEDLRRYARDLGLDPERFDGDRAGEAVFARIRRDVESGGASGEVRGTPTLFVHGSVYRGPYDAATLVELLSR